MANSSQGDQNANRTIIIPKGILNPDQINVINIPRRLNTSAPLLVTPRRDGGLKSQTLPVWKDELSGPGEHGPNLEAKRKACSAIKDGDDTPYSSLYDSSAEIFADANDFIQDVAIGQYNIIKPMTPSPQRPWPKLPEQRGGRGFMPHHTSSPQRCGGEDLLTDSSFPSTMYSQDFIDPDLGVQELSASSASSGTESDCPCPSEEGANATYNIPQYQNATYQRPQNPNATFNQPRLYSTFNRPQNPNATFTRPQNPNATFTRPQNPNATFTRPQNPNATFQRSQQMNQMGYSGTFTDTNQEDADCFCGNATFTRPQNPNATFTRPQNPNATFQRSKQMNQTGYSGTFTDPNQGDADCLCDDGSEADQNQMMGETFSRPQNINQTYTQYGGGQPSAYEDPNCMCPADNADGGYDQQQMGQTFSRPQNINQTYTQYGGGQPSAYEDPNCMCPADNADEGYDQQQMGQTFTQSQSLNQTYTQYGAGQASAYEDPNCMCPADNADGGYEQQQMGRTFTQPQNLNQTYTQYGAGQASAYEDPNCMCPADNADEGYEQQQMGQTFIRSQNINQTYTQYGGGQPSAYEDPNCMCPADNADGGYEQQQMGQPSAYEEPNCACPSDTTFNVPYGQQYQPYTSPAPQQNVSAYYTGGGPSRTMYRTPNADATFRTTMRTPGGANAAPGRSSRMPPRSQNVLSDTTYRSPRGAPGSDETQGSAKYQSCSNMDEDSYGPRIVHMSTRTFSQVNDEPPESQSVSVDAPGGIDEPSLRYATQMATFGDSTRNESYFADQSYSSPSPQRSKRPLQSSRMGASGYGSYADQSGCDGNCPGV